MGITPGAKSRIEEKYRTTDQRIQDPNMFVKDFPVDPPGLFLKTNNFVQQGLNRLLAYSPTEEKWVRVRVDKHGRLAMSQETAEMGWIKLEDREAATIKVFNADSLPAYGIITHEGQDVSGYAKISILISTTQSCTVYVQGSDDNVNWYDYQDETDTARTWACANEKIWFRILNNARYLRILVYNSSSGAATVTGVICGQV